jgi:hypothetical protein
MMNLKSLAINNCIGTVGIIATFARIDNVNLNKLDLRFDVIRNTGRLTRWIRSEHDCWKFQTSLILSTCLIYNKYTHNELDHLNRFHHDFLLHLGVLIFLLKINFNFLSLRNSQRFFG